MNKFVAILLSALPLSVIAQISDAEMIKRIHNIALTDQYAYTLLHQLTKDIGARLSGSPEAAAAVEWSRQKMVEAGMDKVFLQEVMVPHWTRGDREKARIIDSGHYGTIELNVRAIGGSIGTGINGLSSGVIEVKSIEELRLLGRSAVQGKIVFFNRPMDPTLINVFSAYSGAVDQRGSGASEAAALGAIAVVVRSMAINNDDFPHTGGLNYKEGIDKIPAVAISTNDANKLSLALKNDEKLKIYLETHCMSWDEKPSHNVVGELKGSEGKQYIIVGGHLDSWDLGEGAHDDGAGCVQAIDALRILKAAGYQPRNNLRAVMFMNEENGLRGGRKYAELAKKNKEIHMAALESDRGGFVPRGFTTSMTESQKKKLLSWKPLLEPYGLYDFTLPGGGADIGPLADQGTALLGLYPDSQRYFNYHHTDADVFEAVDPRELQLGAAALATMIYLIDKYGI